MTFTGAADIATPNAQWQVSVNGGSSWIDIPGATTDSFTTGTLTNFENGWEVRAVFTNYVGSAATKAATVTILPPTTTVALPSNGATISKTQYLDAVSSQGVTQVQFELSGNGLSDAVVGTATPTIYGWIAAFDTTRVANGTYTLTSVASSGGLTGTSLGISVTVNNSPPTISVALPSKNATVSGIQYLDAAASPGVTQVQFELSGNGLSDEVVGTATPTIYGWIAAFDTTSVLNGTYTLNSVASYGGGVTGTSPGITITVAN